MRRVGGEESPTLARPRGALVLGAGPLSAQLRTQTDRSHRRIEDLLQLPGSIRDRRDYGAWLSRFFGFYQPLEIALAIARQPDGHEGIEITRHSHRLVEDLHALEIDPVDIPRVLPPHLPPFPTFAHVVGARYVLMGATLGGRYIARDLDVRLGTSLGIATRFFGGGGSAEGSTWPLYRNAIDGFGIQYPQLHADVISGAIGTFDALHAWFAPFCDEQSRSR